MSKRVHPLSDCAHSNAAATILGIVCTVLGLALLMFHSLRVEIGTSEISITFGIGWIKKRFPLSQISSARPVTNRWFYGWGIRYTPHGWLFNVSGWDATEIEMHNGKKYRIGSDEPDKLTKAILSAAGRSAT